MIRKLKTGEYRIYSRSIDRKTGKRKTSALLAQGQRQRSMNEKSNFLSVEVNLNYTQVPY